MHLNVTGVIFSRIVDEIIREGQTKTYPLDNVRDSATAIFGVDKGKTSWYAIDKEFAMVHVDGGAVKVREGEVGQHTVRVGSRRNVENYVTAKEIR